MSIFAYVGMPGSGKSYNAVANVIVPALKEGRRVVTNIPLNVSVLSQRGYPGELVEFPVQVIAQEPERIKEVVTPGCVFVLDEVWRLWPAGDKANKVPEPFKSLLAEHRHMVDAKGDSVSIVLLVQDLANIGAFARRLVEQTFLHTKLSHVGMGGRFRVDIYHGPVTGTTGPQSNRLRSIFGTYDKSVWELYKSHTMSQASDQGANEQHIDARGNVLKRPMLIVGAAVVPLLVWYGFHGLSSYYQGHRVSHDGSARGGVAAPAADHPVFADPENSSVGKKEQLPKWRVVGWVINQGDPSRSRAVLMSDSGRTVRVEFGECKRDGGNPLRCELEGYWYSETGRVWPATVGNPIAPWAQPVLANHVSVD